MTIGFPRRMVSRIVERERNGLFRWFYALMGPRERASLLDVGGPTVGLGGIAKRFGTVVVANLAPAGPSYGSVKRMEMIQADARRLPFRDRAFDYVFSNATLEHIPEADWPAVASEIVRVAARGFFVATPNYWFPFEPHYLLPGFQWVPEPIKCYLLFRLGLRIGHMSRAKYHVIRLPRRRQLEQLFKHANVDGWGILVPRHLVVWQRFASAC